MIGWVTSRSRRAARILLAAVVAATTLSTRAFAEPASPQLILPLIAALAVGRSALEVHAAARSEASGLRAMLPKSLHIPDGYEIDFDRDPPRFADPVDRDQRVSLDLLPRPVRGAMVKFSYDEESAPLGDGADLLRVVIERRF